MRKLSLLLICTLLATCLHSQSTRGTEFYFAYMENLNLAFNGPPKFFVMVDAEQTTDGEVQVPATGLVVPFTAIGGEVTLVELPDAIWYSEGTEIVVNKGIRVVSDLPIALTALHYRPYFSEASSILPLDLLGDQYYPTCYVDDNQFNPSASFVIVATKDGEEIEITPTALTEGLRPAGVPFTVTLDEGQIYQVRSQDDLSGTSIRSLAGNPIGVFSGARQANVELCGAADSHLWDQALPLSDWGQEYLFVPFLGQGGDIIKIVASEDNTTVFFDCLEEVVLNTGEVYRIKLTEPTAITATSLISVAQFNSSQDCNPSNVGDPNMLQLFPTSRQLFRTQTQALEYGNGTVPQFFSKHFINIVATLDNTDNITLDGAAIPGGFQPFFGNPNYAYAQVEVDPGSHLIEGDSSFYAYSYGFGDFDAYTYAAGYETIQLEAPSALSAEVEGVFCIDSLLTFRLTGDTTGLTNIVWSLGGSVLSSATNFATDSISPPADYVVTVEGLDANGCYFSIEVPFTLEDCTEEMEEDCAIEFPSAFSPNGDGVNDTFSALFNCIPGQFTLQIYNRWGELVFESNDPEETWDGLDGNANYPSDVFAWVAKFIPADSTTGEDVLRFGEVTLLR